MTANGITKDDTRQVEELFALGAHMGHKKNRLHPRARGYVYKIINGVSIIDLTLTIKDLERAKQFIRAQGKEGKKLLVVATKKGATQPITAFCKENSISYITSKWLSGFLTNFTTLIKNVKKMNELKIEKEKGEWDKFVKHERIALDKELYKLNKLYGGITDMMKKPDVVFVVDIRKEKNTVKEAREEGIPIVALVDTNCDPREVKYPVVVNDDKSGVVEYVSKVLLQAYVDGRKEIVVKEKAA